MLSDLGEPILRRIFERDDGSVELLFFKPVSDPKPEFDRDPDNPPWRCSYAIDFPDGSVISYSVGIDSVQALLLAFAGAMNRLRYVGDGTPTRRPELRWLDEADLGLTINHFDKD